jgi:putative ABC transport system permease protein
VETDTTVEDRGNMKKDSVLRFLEWFCPPELYEGIEGDLLEDFERDVKVVGEKKASQRLLLKVIRFFKPEIILRNRFKIQLINTIMIGNYFKVAARNIQKRKLYSFINAFGLSIGIAFCILIFLFIQDEKSFDQFHENKDRIYRVEEISYNYWNPTIAEKDRYNKSAYVQVPLKQALKDELPEVQYATRFNQDAGGIVKYGEKVFTEKLSYTDGDFFKMFSFKLLSGNADKLFENKQEVVITPKIAEKYFGSEDPIGKTLLIDDEDEKSFIVAGIIESPPANSSIDFDILVPQENRPGYEHNAIRWGNFSTPTFVQLAPQSDLIKFGQNVDKVIQKHMGEKLEEWRKEGSVPANIKLLEYQFTALPDWHLRNEIEWHKVSSPQYSYILGGIAILILLIASINYISLALTTSAARRTEVGIRKAVGAVKNQLIYQFGFESIMLALLSMLVGVGLVILFLPFFNQFTDKGIALTLSNGIQILGVGVALAVIVGMLAGSYPAFFLSGFRPAIVLKGRFTTKVQAGFTRPLVVLQFALSAFLIISSMIMYRQMAFITTKNLGYNQHQIVVVSTQTGWQGDGNKVVEQFRSKLLQERDIISVAGTNMSFNQGWSRYGYKIDGENKSAYVYSVDPDYISTLNMELVMGRNFDSSIPADSNAVVVNEALVKDMKWTDPLNSNLNWREDSTRLGAKVIGVVKDYHFRSLEAPIDPLFLCMDFKNSGPLTTMMIKMSPDNIPATLDKISQAWKELYPDKPFDYTFLDQDVAKQYKSYERWMSIMGLSTGFAILISCLGLFGLAGINAVNRTKEIGIRKVMGAELLNIFVLLNKQYIWLASIAFILAAPASWYIMNQWLADFEFKITIGWQLFAVSMLVGLCIALATVSYHAIKAAFVNPAETLKYE